MGIGGQECVFTTGHALRTVLRGSNPDCLCPPHRNMSIADSVLLLLLQQASGVQKVLVTGIASVSVQPSISAPKLYSLFFFPFFLLLLLLVGVAMNWHYRHWNPCILRFCVCWPNPLSCGFKLWWPPHVAIVHFFSLFTKVVFSASPLKHFVYDSCLSDDAKWNEIDVFMLFF